MVTVGVLAALVVGWTGLALLQARADLVAARDALQQARTTDRVEEVGPLLAQARTSLDDAVGWLGQLGPQIAEVAPVVGRSVRAVETVAVAARAVVAGSEPVVGVATSPASPLLTKDGVTVDGLGRLADQLENAAATAREPVQSLTNTSSFLLPGPVGRPLVQAQAELGDKPETFARAAAGLRGLRSVLGADRPRRLLVLLENNAELRGSGGTVTVFAEATASNGRVQVGGFRDIDSVAAKPPNVVRVPAPADYRALYGPFLADSTLWVNTNMSPDLPTSSAVLAEVAAASLPVRPDAMVWLDVPAIAAVLRATGPATLPDGSELRADNAVDVLLSQAYREAVDTTAGQAARRAILRGAADAVIGRLLGSTGQPPSLTRLGPELAATAAGRHLAVWSAEPAEQSQLRYAGLAGQVAADGGDLSAVAVQNLGGGDSQGNKLDYYARRSISVRATVGERSAEVSQQVVLRNGAPVGGLPAYVAGVGTPGVTNNLVSLALPAGAQLLSFRRGDAQLGVETVPAGDHAVVTDVVSLPPGTATTWTLRYRTPVEQGRYALGLFPQPLAFDADLELELRPAAGLDLEVGAGSPLVQDRAGVLRRKASYDQVLDLRMQVRRTPLAARIYNAVRKFWDEPVRLR